MSSVLRRPAQIPARIPYFVTVDSTDAESATLADAPALDLSGATTLSGLNTFVNVADMATYFTANTSIVAGRLLKDLGQEIIIVDDASNYVARYRNVLVVNGASTEGIATVGGANVLVRVWAADGTNVVVARTG
jgi:hypothetical protein